MQHKKSMSPTSSSKLEELLSLFHNARSNEHNGGRGITLVEPREVPELKLAPDEVVYENARLKACYAAVANGLPALAEDSGLFVQGLDGGGVK